MVDDSTINHDIMPMGDLQDPKMEVRKRTIFLGICSRDIP